MGQFRGNNMNGIRDAFARAQQAKQTQQPRSGGKFNRPQPTRPTAQPTMGAGPRALPNAPQMTGGLKQARMGSGPKVQPATTQPVQPRNQAYSRMLGAKMRGNGRGRGGY